MRLFVIVACLASVLAWSMGGEEQRLPENEPPKKGDAPTIEAWDYFRLTDVGPVLMPMMVRMAKTLKPSVRLSGVWEGEPQNTTVKLDIRVEAEKGGDILIGFFESPDWSAPPKHVRSFPAAGQYTLRDIPPGKYFLGAVMGMPQEPWPEAGHYRYYHSQYMTGRAPKSSGLGVHKSWPRPVIIEENETTNIPLLVSEGFGLGTMKEMMLPWYGRWKKMDPTHLTTIRTLDHEGNPVPFCRIVLLTRQGERYMHFKELGTDAMGYGYCDYIDESFIVTMAQRFFLDPETLTHGYQSIGTEEVYLATDRPFITIRFEPLPKGHGKVAVKIRDQHGRPIQGYYLNIRKLDGDWTGAGDKTSVGLSTPVANSEGAFQVTDLAPGKYKMSVRGFDISAYVTRRMEFTVPREEAATIEQDLEVEAK